MHTTKSKKKTKNVRSAVYMVIFFLMLHAGTIHVSITEVDLESTENLP